MPTLAPAPAATGRLAFSFDEPPHGDRGLLGGKGVGLTGGIASHAALVARGMGKPCVAGCEPLEDGVLPEDPFATLDRRGVGELMRTAVERGRATRPVLTVGICGEHGGDPASTAFCHEFGVDYVSCSPCRVPATRLAAALAERGAGAYATAGG